MIAVGTCLRDEVDTTASTGRNTSRKPSIETYIVANSLRSSSVPPSRLTLSCSVSTSLSVLDGDSVSLVGANSELERRRSDLT